MKKFVIILSGKTPGSLSDDLLHRHVAYLRELHKQGLLFICGPLKKSDKAMKIIYADSMGDAENLAAKDPFTAEGYYPDTQIYELAEANEENNYLLR